jgi:hypothetical protein
MQKQDRAGLGEPSGRRWRALPDRSRCAHRPEACRWRGRRKRPLEGRNRPQGASRLGKVRRDFGRRRERHRAAARPAPGVELHRTIQPTANFYAPPKAPW